MIADTSGPSTGARRVCIHPRRGGHPSPRAVAGSISQARAGFLSLSIQTNTAEKPPPTVHICLGGRYKMGSMQVRHPVVSVLAVILVTVAFVYASAAFLDWLGPLMPPRD